MIKILKGLVLDSIYLYLIQGLNYVLPFLILPYLIKILSPSSFGIVVYSQSVTQLIILFVDFGFNISTTKKIATLQDQPNKIVEVFWITLLTKTIFFLICFVFTIIFFATFDRFHLYAKATNLSMVSLLGTALFPVWYFQGADKLKQLSVINATSKILTYPLIFILVTKSNDFLLAVTLQAVSPLLAAIISLTFILRQKSFRYIKVKDFSQALFYQNLKEAWPIFLSNSSISLYTSGLTVLLGFYASAAQIGFFGAIEKIVKAICFGVYVPINQSAFPKLSKLKKENFAAAKKLFSIVFYGVLLIMIFSIGCFFLMENLVINYFMKRYDGSMLVLRLSIFAIIPIALGGVCGQLGLIALGDDKQKKIFSNVYLIIGLLSFIYSFLSIKYYLVNGAIFSMIATELFIFFAMFNYAKKYDYL